MGGGIGDLAHEERHNVDYRVGLRLISERHRVAAPLLAATNSHKIGGKRVPAFIRRGCRCDKTIVVERVSKANKVL